MEWAAKTRSGSGRQWCESAGGSAGRWGLAEPWNAVSSLGIAAWTLGGLPLNQGYLRQRPAAAVVYAAVVLTAAASAYFHARLSLVGQALDELGIVWSIVLAGVVWLPGLEPRQALEWAGPLRAAAVGLGLLATGLVFLRPQLNAFVLMGVLPVSVAVCVVREVDLVPARTARRLSWAALSLVVLAVAVWVAEEVGCQRLLRLGFPHLHSLWHLLIGLAIYTGILLFQFTDAWKRGLRPALAHEHGYPFLSINAPFHS